MKIKFYSLSEIEKIRSSSVLEGKRISPDINIDYITSKHVGFSCFDKKLDTKHSVIYFSEKKFPDSWLCDCKWSSLKKGLCKHILSVFFRLNQDENFLKNIEKERISN